MQAGKIHLIAVEQPEYRHVLAKGDAEATHELRVDAATLFQGGDTAVLGEVRERTRLMTGRYTVRLVEAVTIFACGSGLLRLKVPPQVVAMVLCVLLSGCGSGRALRPGRAAASLSASAALPTTTEVVQPENPEQTSTHEIFPGPEGRGSERKN